MKSSRVCALLPLISVALVFFADAAFAAAPDPEPSAAPAPFAGAGLIPFAVTALAGAAWMIKSILRKVRKSEDDQT